MDSEISADLDGLVQLAHQGNFVEASRSLRELMQSTSDQMRHENFSGFLRLAFAARDFGIVSSLLVWRFSPSCQILVETTHLISETCIILFEKLSSNVVRLAFSSDFPNSSNLTGEVGWLIHAMQLIVRAASSERVPAGSAFLNQSDAGILPGLSYCANSPEFFLMPDNVFINTEGHRALKKKLSDTVLDWSSRKPIAFWRGATTGIVLHPAVGWRSLQRVMLCEISQRYPELLDAGINKIVQFSLEKADEIRESGLIKETFPADRLQEYRYLVDVDGNSNAWGGFFERLLSGSPVLKVASPRGYTEWYYSRLIPWCHYVPVSADLSDLMDKIEWLKRHDDQAQEIGRNGKTLATSLEYDREMDKALDAIAAAFRALSALQYNAIYAKELHILSAQRLIFSFRESVIAYDTQLRRLVHVRPELLLLSGKLLPIGLSTFGGLTYLLVPSGGYISIVDEQGTAELEGEPNERSAFQEEKRDSPSIEFFTLRLGNKFVCADSDDFITISRNVASDWELFRCR